MNKPVKVKKKPGPKPGTVLKDPSHYIQSITNALRLGMYLETAVILAGTTKDTFFEWMRRGNKEPFGPYRELLDAVNKAVAEGEARHLANIDRAGRNQWQASAWMLERRHHSKWAKRETQRFEHANADDKPFKVTTDLSEQEIEARMKLLRSKISAEG
jgi:hypothetical protein